MGLLTSERGAEPGAVGGFAACGTGDELETLRLAAGPVGGALRAAGPRGGDLGVAMGSLTADRDGSLDSVGLGAGACAGDCSPDGSGTGERARTELGRGEAR